MFIMFSAFLEHISEVLKLPQCNGRKFYHGSKVIKHLQHLTFLNITTLHSDQYSENTSLNIFQYSKAT